MSRMNSSIAMAGGLSLFKLSVFEQGKSYDLSPPSDF